MRFSMTMASVVVLGTLALAQDTGATTARLRVVSPRSEGLAERLIYQGFDVAIGSATQESFEVFAQADELARLEALGLDLTLIDMGRPLKEIQAERAGSAKMLPSGYQDLPQIYAQMQQAAADHPNICEFVDLTALLGTPTTAQGRSLFAVKISDNVGVDEDEPNSMFVGCHHAREAVTPVVCLVAIDELTDGYASNPSIQALVDDNEIWIAPVWNPDGYNHVFHVDNNWRKNRRPNGGSSFGVDQNRNYDAGWSNGCSGSTNTSSNTYKGPSANSEPETQTMIALANARHFAKVFDFHSSGQETLWSYACWNHPWDNFWEDEAGALSIQAGYGLSERRPSADGEHQQWHFAKKGSMSFLMETANQFQPSYASAVSEANAVFNAITGMLDRAMPLDGHVVDACNGAPIAATIEITNVSFPNGETNESGGPFGRYQYFAPSGTYMVRASAPGYVTQTQQILVNSNVHTTLDFQLDAVGGGSGCSTIYCTPKVNSQFCVPGLSVAGSPSVSSGQPFLLNADQVINNKNGLLFYGFAANSLPFQGGFLCVQPPTKRTVVQDSAGNPPPNDCSGTYSFDFNALIQSGADPALTVGTQVNAQFWSRDPQEPLSGTGLTGGVEFVIGS